MKLSAFFATVVISQFPLGCSVYTRDLLDRAPTTNPDDDPDLVGSMGGSSGAGNPPIKGAPDAGMEPGERPDPPDSGSGGAGGAPPSDNDSGIPSAGDGGGGANPAPADGGSVDGGAGGAQPPRDPALVDDFEDQNKSILPRGERAGFWFTGGNPEDTGTISPLGITELMPPRGDSEYGLHIVASGYVADPTWAVLGVNFNVKAGTPSPYAGADNYSGIRFWAKHGGSDESDTVRVELPTTDTSGTPPYTGNDDNHGMLITLEPEWTQHTILWDDPNFAQGGWGDPEDLFPFIPEKVTSIQFKLHSPPETGFDIWLDDMEFVE